MGTNKTEYIQLADRHINTFGNCTAPVHTRHSTKHGSRPMIAVSFLVGHRGGSGDRCGRIRVTVTAERSLSTWPAPGKQKNNHNAGIGRPGRV